MNPVLYQDRTAVAALAAEDVLLLEALREWGVGKIDLRETIHFCGLVQAKGGRLAVFVPRGTKELNLETARLLMSCLARYGHETTSREFTSDGSFGNPGTLSVIARLANDFRQNGLYIERRRVRSRNNGKPDWKRTVVRERAFVGSNGAEFYTQLATTKPVNSSETLLAKIQAAVMLEIVENHGWWLNGLSSRLTDLRAVDLPHQPRKMWPTILDALLPRLYSTRSIFLTNYLSHYIRNCRASNTGNFVFGVEDFHVVWESMLRQTIKNVRHGWNSRLPKAVYNFRSGGNAEAPERTMLTDIVIQDETGFAILDAKYYGANSSSSVPGWPDIAKQMFYELALRSVVGEKVSVRNCFVFPAQVTGEGVFEDVRMRASDRPEFLKEFPSIKCHYLSVTDVMKAYRDNRKDVVF